MHPSSYDKMAAFCGDFLEARRAEPLTIVDLGSADYNGSYRPIFDRAPWRYIGVDVEPGPNVELVLPNHYDWQELSSGSVDVLVSGQTFEHTEFFWETMLEIARVLKPGGLCCIIAPAAGPEHRFPIDCWRIFSDGFRAVARYANLRVLHATTQWDELPQYDHDSNKWHESVLIAQKREESGARRLRGEVFRFLKRHLQPPPGRPETLVQVFHTHDGLHREEDSLLAGVEQGEWEDLTVTLPAGAGAAPLRVDFMRTLPFIDVAEVQLAGESQKLESIRAAGDCEQLPHPRYLRLKITGVDPQLYLPSFVRPGDAAAIRLHLRLRVTAAEPAD